MSYAAVPLYKIFCRATGFGGTPKIAEDASRPSLMATASSLIPTGHPSGGNIPDPNSVKQNRTLRVYFNSDVSAQLGWELTPEQREIKLKVGETALVFYEAINKMNSDSVGIATYNITPLTAAQYFNKIQCFCFEYQRLKANERVNFNLLFRKL